MSVARVESCSSVIGSRLVADADEVMNKQWKIKVGDKVFGPAGTDTVQKLISDKKLPEGFLIREDSTDEWK